MGKVGVVLISFEEYGKGACLGEIQKGNNIHQQCGLCLTLCYRVTG